jgi:hypothetical protein
MTFPSRKILALTLAGAGLLAGLYLTLDNVRATLESQVADRLAQAVGHLGHENLGVRLGGIFALEQLARSSEKDAWPIMEILAAYVRERVPAGKTPAPQEPPPRLAEDVQAALDVLGRRRHAYREGETRRLDLRGTDLRRANLAGANFEGAILSEVHLEDANLAGVRLNDAILRSAHLKKADLTEATLEKAYLLNTRFTGAKLRGANLRESYLQGTSFAEADLRGADLTDAFGLTWEQLQAAYKDHKTRLPAYLRNPPPSPES